MSLKNLNKIIKQVQNILISKTNILLIKKYKKNENNKSKLQGHCYVATEVLYHIYGKNNGYKPKVFSNKLLEKNEEKQFTHWFLENKENGHIIDPTAEQFETEIINFCYKNAKFKGFLTGDNPSNRSKIVLDEYKKLSKTISKDIKNLSF